MIDYEASCACVRCAKLALGVYSARRFSAGAERGRLIMGDLDFGEALKLLRDGKAVERRGWNGKKMWLRLQVPDEHSKMTLPYIYMRTAQGDLVPWLASQSDILAQDWLEVPGER